MEKGTRLNLKKGNKKYEDLVYHFLAKGYRAELCTITNWCALFSEKVLVLTLIYQLFLLEIFRAEINDSDVLLIKIKTTTNYFVTKI